MGPFQAGPRTGCRWKDCTSRKRGPCDLKGLLLGVTPPPPRVSPLQILNLEANFSAGSFPFCHSPGRCQVPISHTLQRTLPRVCTHFEVWKGGGEGSGGGGGERARSTHAVPRPHPSGRVDSNVGLLFQSPQRTPPARGGAGRRRSRRAPTTKVSHRLAGDHLSSARPRPPSSPPAVQQRMKD